MFRNVVAALNEALDITMHLKPLTAHFQVTENDYISLKLLIASFETTSHYTLQENFYNQGRQRSKKP